MSSETQTEAGPSGSEVEAPQTDGQAESQTEQVVAETEAQDSDPIRAIIEDLNKEEPEAPETDDEGREPEAKADESDPKPKPEKPADPEALTDSERKAVGAKVAAKVSKLLDLRTELRTKLEETERQAQAGEGIITLASKAGLIRQTEGGGLDGSRLTKWLDLASDINTQPPEKAAERLRALADRIHKTEPSDPYQFDGDLPRDLAAKVETLELTSEEATALAAFRASRNPKRQPKPKPEPEQEEPQREPERRPDPVAVAQEREARGLDLVRQESTKFQKSNPLDWEKIKDRVADEVIEQARELHIPPERWGQLTQRAITKAIKERQRTVKPTTSVSPNDGRRPSKTQRRLTDDPVADVIALLNEPD